MITSLYGREANSDLKTVAIKIVKIAQQSINTRSDMTTILYFCKTILRIIIVIS